ncbi:MAG: dockerin type I domain-containing protein [Halobacteriota archaeon]|nr:dockerin type I domain-containing protein [Halobacteriota archaeon]
MNDIHENRIRIVERKELLSILLTGIIWLSIFTAMIPTASAAGPERILDSNTDLTGTTVLIGEKINVTNLNASASISVVFIKTSAPNEGHTFTATVVGTGTTDAYASRETTGVALEGQYNITYYEENSESATTETIYLDPITFGFRIEDTTGYEISSLQKNGLFKIDVTGNVPLDVNIDLEIADPNGIPITADGSATPQVLTNQTIETIEGYTINTTGWNTGDYQISIVTKPKYARGLDEVTITKTLKISNMGVSITVDVPSSATIGEEVKIKGTTTLPDSTDIDIIVKKRYNMVVDSKHNVDITNGYFEWDWDTSDMKTGSYKITAFWDEDNDNTLDLTEDTKDIKSIIIEPPSLTLDPIPDVDVGDDLEITGTTNRADGTPFIINVEGPGTDETATIEAADGAISATFDTTGWQAGSYYVTAEDKDITCSDEAYFNVVKRVPNIMVDLSLTPTTVKVGEDVIATVTATNKGTASGTVYASLTIEGVEVKAVDLEVAAGSSESFTYTYTATQSGVYIFDANGATATLLVQSVATISIPDVMAKGIVTVPIEIEDAENVGACQLTLKYDPSVAIVSEVISSDFDSINANLRNALIGKVRLNVFQGASPGLNGDVILADLNITIVGDLGSSTSLNLYVEGLFDAEASSNPISYKTDDGSIYVTLNGDVNNDDAVDVSDCMYLAKHLLKIQGFETIDEVASDVNGDGEIDISDRMYLAKHLAGMDGFEVLI